MSGASIHEALCDAIEAATSLVRSPVPFSALEVPEHLAAKVFALRCDGSDNDGDLNGGDAVVRREWTCAIHYRLTQDPHGGIQTALSGVEAVLAVLHADPIDVARTDVGRVEWSYPGDGHHAVAEIPFVTESYEAVD